jgi:hypothetical protein
MVKGELAQAIESENIVYYFNCHKILRLFLCLVSFRIAYSVYMLKDMVEKTRAGNYDIKLMYDIGCLLDKHLRVIYV